MTANFRVYLTDSNDEIYCFNCAVKSIMKREQNIAGKTFKFNGEDFTDDGCDMRNTPKCSICGLIPGERIAF